MFSEVGCNAAEDIIQEYTKKLKVARNYGYSADIMKFSITLQGYSNKGYNFVRNTFANCLPHPRTLFNHLSKLDVEPGIRNSPFWLIKNKVDDLKEKSINNKLYLSLAVDDISIRNAQLIIDTHKIIFYFF